MIYFAQNLGCQKLPQLFLILTEPEICQRKLFDDLQNNVVSKFMPSWRRKEVSEWIDKIEGLDFSQMPEQMNAVLNFYNLSDSKFPYATCPLMGWALGNTPDNNFKDKLDVAYSIHCMLSLKTNEFSVEKAAKWLGRFRCIVVGGHDNWIAQMKHYFPDWEYRTEKT